MISYVLLILPLVNAYLDVQNMSLYQGSVISGLELNSTTDDSDNSPSVAAAGDFNGDGYDDVLIGVNSENCAYLLYGGPSSVIIPVMKGNFTVNNSLDPTQGIKFTGPLHSLFGYSVGTAGDINKDGYSDILIGAQDEGAAYLIFGDTMSNLIRKFGSSFQVSGSMNDEGIRFVNANTGASNFGCTVSSGDVNGDGFSDIAIGAYGENSIYILFGDTLTNMFNKFTNNFNVDTTTLTASQGMKWTSSNNAGVFGWSITLGDINNDGFSEIIIGSFTESAIYILYGASSSDLVNYWGGFNLPFIVQPSLTSYQGFQIVYTGSNSYFGWSVSFAGDLNKDGFGDILIGSWTESLVYLIFGETRANLLTRYGSSYPLTNNFFPSTYGLQITNFNPSSTFGFTVAAAGDINGDGYSDILVGSQGEKSAYILFGPTFITEPIKKNRDVISQFISLEDSTIPSSFGISLSTAGDFNKDGYHDIIVKDTISGKAYLIWNYQQCNIPCEKCDQSDPDKCLSCVYTRPFIYKNKCFTECPQGTNAQSSKTCVDCNDDECQAKIIKKSAGIPLGTLIGIILGGAAILILTLLIVYLFKKKKMSHKRKSKDKLYLRAAATTTSDDLESPSLRRKVSTFTETIKEGSTSPTKEGTKKEKFEEKNAQGSEFELVPTKSLDSVDLCNKKVD